MDSWSIGIDIVEIDRFRKHNLKVQRKFYNRMFNDYEIFYCLKFKDPYPHFAGLFAAKEAVFKALNEFSNLGLYDIYIKHTKLGKPIVKPDFWESRDLPEKEFTIKVSISHTKVHAIAWAVVIKDKNTSQLKENWEKINNKIQSVIQDELAKEKNN